MKRNAAMGKKGGGRTENMTEALALATLRRRFSDEQIYRMLRGEVKVTRRKR
jgi:hypothetical protein